MMSRKLELSFNIAIRKANELKHEYLTLESVFWALLTDTNVVAVLNDCNVDIEELKRELEGFLEESNNFGQLTDERIEELSKEQFHDENLRQLASEDGIKYRPEISVGLQRVIQNAAIHVRSAGKQKIFGVNLLVSFFQETESFSFYLLKKQGVEKLDLIQSITQGADETGVEDFEGENDLEGAEKLSNQNSNTGFLGKYTVNLNELAQDDKIDPIIGRKRELKRLAHILARRRRNNPLLVGDAGVGKTAIAEGLARKIVRDEVEDFLRDTTIYSLDMASIIAGAKYRGEFEQRLKGVINELLSLQGKEQKVILFIDEIHTVIGAGSTGGGSMDASNLLKPVLTNGVLRCIGSTTHEECKKFIEKDHAFGRRFQKIDIEEPSSDDTLKILQGLRSKFEDHHGVKYPTSVLKTAINLAVKFINDKKLPDKAIDVIDEAGAALNILPEGKKRVNVTVKDIEEVVSTISKVPKVSVVGNEKKQLKSLRENLEMLIFGQNDAIEKVNSAIMLSRSGLSNHEKPVGCFLFTGPTGVGKTELAKQLSLNLNIHFERFDMSEYMEKHAVAKLIGAPPGYVGHDQGGLLTDAIKRNPHCVLLLDEIEKAHIDIYNILLQVMDHGLLTDSLGKRTDFRNVILILTTNAGAAALEAGSIGLKHVNKGQKERISKVENVLKTHFTPEFRNRLDAIIHFNKLSKDNILRIVDKFLTHLEVILLEKNIELVVKNEVREWLADNGYDAKMGARPIERIIDKKIKRPLSTEILFGKLEKGGKVIINLRNEEIDFDFSVRESL